MALASIIRDSSFELGFVRSSDQNAGKAKQLVEMNGSYRTRKLDMNGAGTNAQINNLGLLTMLGNAKTLTLCGEAASYNDVRSREDQLKIDMVRAFGGEIAHMNDFVKDIMHMLGEGSPLSIEQQDQLFELATEIVNLKNLTNVGVMPEAAAKLESMIAEVAHKIADLLLDGMDNKIIPKSVADVAHNMVVDVAEKYNVASLEDKITKIEGRVNPQEYHINAVEAVIAHLAEMLENEDLSEDAKAEIESLIEQMETALENGEPIPADTIKALETLGENHADITVTADLAQALETLKDATIVMMADKYGVTVAQMRQIESLAEASDVPLQDVSVVEAIIEKLGVEADSGPVELKAAHNVIDLADAKVLQNQTMSSPTIETPRAESMPPVTPFIPLAGFGIGGGNQKIVTVSPPAPTSDSATESPSTPKGRGDDARPAPPSPPADPSPNPEPDNPVTPPRNPDNPDFKPEESPKDPPRQDENGGGAPTPPPEGDGKPSDPDPAENKKLPEDNPEKGPDSKPENPSDGGGTSKGHDPETSKDKPCVCPPFQKVADPSKTLDELKQAMKDQALDGGITNQAINDKFAENYDQLSESQQKAFILDIAKEDFGGDVTKARSHIESVNRLYVHEQAQAKERAEIKAEADEVRNARIEAAKPEEGKRLPDIYNPKGCPVHGDGGCPEGSHATDVTTSENKKSARKRGLSR